MELVCNRVVYYKSENKLKIFKLFGVFKNVGMPFSVRKAGIRKSVYKFMTTDILSRHFRDLRELTPHLS